jgi:TolB protein
MSPAWFPDGRNLLYTTTDAASMYPSGSLFEIALDGGTPKNVAPAGARARSISPDGSRLLFLTQRWEVAVLDLRTKTVSVVSHPASGTWDTEAAWSPDGKKIAFGCNFSPSATVGRSDICIMNADGSGRRILSRQDGAAEWVTWAPDGTRIAFQSDSHNYTVGAIVVADVETGRARTISGATGYALNETPDWSRDGRWIALQVKTKAGYRIAVIRPDGTGFHTIT